MSRSSLDALRGRTRKSRRGASSEHLGKAQQQEAEADPEFVSGVVE